MMNKMKSAKAHLAKFLFVLPVVMVVLLAFRSKQQMPGYDEALVIAQSESDTIPAPPPPPVNELPPNVKSIQINNDVITVVLKNGKKEIYHKSNSGEMKAYEEKYGELTPPPPPPAPPQKVSKNGLNSKGNYITVAHSDDDRIVIVKNKEKKIVTTLSLDEWNSNKSYEEKYGEIPPPPPIVIRVAPGVKGELQEIRVESTEELKEVRVTEPVKIVNVKVAEDVKVAEEVKGVRVTKQPVKVKVVEGVKAQSNPVIALEPKETVNLQLKNNTPATVNVSVGVQPLYVIDGVVQPEGTALENIKPDEIARINVLKSASAMALYGDAAKAGVIDITTKKAAGNSDDVVVKGYGKATIRDLSDFEGLIIVDGKEYDKKSFKELDIPAEKIGSMHIYKGDDAVQKFGEKGRKGVIEIKTKDPVITKKPVSLQLKKSNT